MVKQERAVRTRKSLIRAAAEVFAEEGYAPASLTTISKRAGVSNGALHFHFQTKNELAQAVEDEAVDVVARLVKGTLGPEGGPLQALVDATYGLMGCLSDDIVVRAGFELCGDRARRSGSQLVRHWHQWVEEVLSRAEEEGHLASGVSPEDAAAAIVAVTVGLEVLGGEDPRWFAERRIIGFWSLLLPSLAREHVLLSPRRNAR
ncbi:ScbR family autoregulator-binding transcription factor [Streptomyces monashensis]|uniref:HTH tetR-type domain-containing protein n=1 Tax=Streptomyces monashensis TaxID=1678012 RepID=A0A1S2QIP7_9ACTN|nr:ScbR family autoregulator-binding transcription factor [Streptomyces monashensis]OIK06012.1 hypothetical protein BIV23_09975 [Streptomyces monashensis]